MYLIRIDERYFMNRTIFRLTGLLSLVLMIPYFCYASPLLAYLFFAGFVIGIMWCMFAIEYRGVWFRPGDPAKPQKFDDADLPVMKTIGTGIQEQTKESVLYAWDMVLRPVLMPDGTRLFNIRYDFVPSRDGSLAFGPDHPPVELKRGVPITLSLRAGLRGGAVFYTEFQVNRKHPLSGPANRKVSPLNLKNSDPALKIIIDRMAQYPESDLTWGIAFIDYVRLPEPRLHAGIEVAALRDLELEFAGVKFPLNAGKRLALEFDIDPLLTTLSNPRKAGRLKKILAFQN